MPAKLPLFPLQIVVFPQENLNLHIFEPRYRQLIEDAEARQITWGIPAHIGDRVMPVGTEVELLEVVRRFPTGESDISTRAVGLFRLESFEPRLGDRLYGGGEVERISYEQSEDLEVNARILYLVRELFQLLHVKKELPPDPTQFSTYAVAHHVGFTIEQEYQFLCTFDARSRQALLVSHLERILPMVRETEAIKVRARMNGHFKNVLPPNV